MGCTSTILYSLNINSLFHTLSSPSSPVVTLMPKAPLGVCPQTHEEILSIKLSQTTPTSISLIHQALRLTSTPSLNSYLTPPRFPNPEILLFASHFASVSSDNKTVLVIFRKSHSRLTSLSPLLHL